MREKILAHPIRWLIGLCACLVFFGCFGFPIYNFTTGRRFGSWYLLSWRLPPWGPCPLSWTTSGRP